MAIGWLIKLSQEIVKKNNGSSDIAIDVSPARHFPVFPLLNKTLLIMISRFDIRVDIDVENFQRVTC